MFSGKLFVARTLAYLSLPSRDALGHRTVSDVLRGGEDDHRRVVGGGDVADGDLLLSVGQIEIAIHQQNRTEAELCADCNLDV